MSEANFIDDAFFGFSRTGKYRNSLSYPSVVRTEKSDLFKSTDEGFEIAGNFISKSELLPFSEKNPSDNFVVSEDFVTLSDAPALISRSRRFVSTLMEIHKRFGFSKLIYAPGIADPYLIPVLVYSGINLFDDVLLTALATRGLRTGIFGLEKEVADSRNTNLEFSDEIIREVSKAIENRTLREIVEKYQFSSKAVEVLRILDTEHQDSQLQMYPAFTPYIRSNGELSLLNPSLVSYRNRIKEIYTRPSGRDILLILPCSARKPYSASKSHKRIIDAISEYRRQIHELIVTSPIGIVPRDIEELYPSAFYDIPVIGKWYEEEKAMIKDMLSAYFKRNRYRKVVAFIPEDLTFITDSLPEGSLVIRGTSRRDTDLRALRTTISQIFDPSKKASSLPERFEAFVSMAKFQYGDWIGDHISGCKLIKSYGQEMLSRSGKVVMVFNPRIGKITITKEIAGIFLENKRHVVYIDDFKPTANVYAVGVLDVSQDVRQEADVVVAHDTEVRGVGVAKMPVPAMINLKKGIAVKMRN